METHPLFGKKQKDLEVYSRNQMRRRLCEINRMLNNKIEIGEKLPQKYSQRFINWGKENTIEFNVLKLLIYVYCV